MKVALVHESLTARGGAERVLAELQRVFPDAPLYVLESSPQAVRTPAGVHTSFLNRLPSAVRKRRFHLPLAPVAPETFDLSDYDVVISSASAFAKGIITRPGSLHLCYCHSPTRYLWDATADVVRELPPGTVRKGLLAVTFHVLRLWDRSAARRVDRFITNSETTKARIRKYYGRDAVVIPPPVQLGPRVSGSGQRERRYFLFVGRLSPSKRADLVVEAFNKLALPLVIAGEGRDRKRLERSRGPTVTLLGAVPDDALPRLYAGARAVIFPSDDDFGLVPLEANAAGTPVLALRRGGATETVIEGVTGEFFDEPAEEFLADCVRRFLEREGSYHPDVLRAHAARFSADRFRHAISAFVHEAWLVRARQRSTDAREKG